MEDVIVEDRQLQNLTQQAETSFVDELDVETEPSETVPKRTEPSQTVPKRTFVDELDELGVETEPSKLFLKDCFLYLINILK